MADSMFPLAADTTEYLQLSDAGLRLEQAFGRDHLLIDPQVLTDLAERAFGDINHFLRTEHLQSLRRIYDDPEASANDRFVAYDFLKNACVAAGGVLPMCQDTGTVIVSGYKGAQVQVLGSDREALAEGARRAYAHKNLRYSQLAPLSMYVEKNTGTNLPGQIDLYAAEGESYELQFIAKGGGSANKTFLYQGTPSLLAPDRLPQFVCDKLADLGTSACPPYHLAIVIGGTSAEMNLKTVKAASTRALDSLPTSGSPSGHAFRDLEFEAAVLEYSQKLGLGAQFGGKYFCHDVRVIRLPRHGASLPIGIGVSCSADRQVKAHINRRGVFLEKLETDPARFLPEPGGLSNETVAIDLNRPMSEILAALRACPLKTRVSLTGPLLVARDLAHARIRKMLDDGLPMPEYFKNHPIYYAGPAKTPVGLPSGSFGPTTAGRMDSYVDRFQSLGGSMVMLAKGNRSPQVRSACKAHGGFYLGTVGGAAARLAAECIRKIEVIDFADLGMEAVHRIEVENFPAFVVIDHTGADFFAEFDSVVAK